MLAKGVTTDKMQPLAPQQIVDCDDSDGGCDGGNPPTAYQYVIGAGGMETEKNYPYKVVNGDCAFKSSLVYANISDWKYATNEDDEGQLQANLVSYGPLSICVDAQYWQDYQSGVMTGSECCWWCQLDHCVQLVGYDTTASTPYWLIRNSWGTSWGESGYIRVQSGDNACGLTDEATTSVVQK